MSKQAPSVQLWSIREPFGADMNASLARLAQMGFTQVEPFGHGDFSDGGFFDELAAALKANNLTAPTMHFQVYGKELAPFFGAAKKLGVQTIIDPMIDPELWKTRESVVELAKAVTAIADEAAKHGFKFGYHNHAFEFETKIDGTSAWTIFVENLGDNVVIELDTYWAHIGGADAVEEINKLGNRLVAIHVKDGKRVPGLTFPDIAKHQVPAGQGEVPVAAIIKAAQNAIPVVEFDFYEGGDIFDGVEASLKFVNEVRA